MTQTRVPTVHKKKILPEFFKAVCDGSKSFEIRKEDDTQYAVGDVLVLEEFNDYTGEFSGRSETVEITYITRDPRFVKQGHAVMSIRTYPHFATTKRREM